MPLTRRTLILTGLASLSLPVTVHAGSTRISTGKTDWAIRGYDTRAYWRASMAAPGQDTFTVLWRGVPWRFATAEDAARFEASPEAFAPQFGGFCTRAMSFKKVVDGDPEVWRIYNDKLYLFAKPVGGRVFDKEQDDMIAKAQAFWDTLA